MAKLQRAQTQRATQARQVLVIERLDAQPHRAHRAGAVRTHPFAFVTRRMAGLVRRYFRINAIQKRASWMDALQRRHHAVAFLHDEGLPVWSERRVLPGSAQYRRRASACCECADAPAVAIYPTPSNAIPFVR